MALTRLPFALLSSEAGLLTVYGLTFSHAAGGSGNKENIPGPASHLRPAHVPDLRAVTELIAVLIGAL